MMLVLVNYSNKAFRKSQILNSETGIKIGRFDRVLSYTPDVIDQEFYEKHRHILSLKRGNGYWLWKPYILKKALDELKDGDYLFYCDSGALFVSSVIPIVELSLTTGCDIITFELTLKEKAWTKRDAFILMDCDSPEYTDSNQRFSGYMLFKKSAFTVEVLNEFLFYAQDARIITDLDNKTGLRNFPEFIEHRHDQSIFSLLTKKYGIKAYRDPSQFGLNVMQDYPDSNYGQIIDAIRAKKNPIYYRILGKVRKLTNYYQRELRGL